MALNGRNISDVTPEAFQRPDGPYQALPTRKTTHRETIATSGPDPSLQDPLGHERTADERERRSHELHDFDFVAPGIGREPDDVGDGQGGGDAEEQRR